MDIFSLTPEQLADFASTYLSDSQGIHHVDMLKALDKAKRKVLGKNRDLWQRLDNLRVDIGYENKVW